MQSDMTRVTANDSSSETGAPETPPPVPTLPRRFSAAPLLALIVDWKKEARNKFVSAGQHVTSGETIKVSEALAAWADVLESCIRDVEAVLPAEVLRARLLQQQQEPQQTPSVPHV